MTVTVLKRVVADALAEIGAPKAPAGKAERTPRDTTWLDIERGLGVHRYPSGRQVYIVQARMSGRTRTVTIGPTTLITEHQAAAVARRVTASALMGFDPASDRQRIRSAPSFTDFLDEYWKRWSPHWKPSTLATHDKYRRLYLEDAFPDISIDALTEADVTRWFASLNDRLGPGGANRVMSILNNMLNKAERWGYRPENANPCRAVRLNRKRRCDRFLSLDELQRLGIVLEQNRVIGSQVRRTAAAAITLLLLTGCRAGEILDLQWGDLRGNRLKLRDSKTGPRTVWLGNEARSLISGLPRLRNIPWIFWNEGARKPVRCLDYHWKEIRSQANLAGVRLHDLRHTFASHAAMNKETLPMIGRLLGHVNPRSTARYAHFDDEHIFTAVTEIGATVELMLR